MTGFYTWMDSKKFGVFGNGRFFIKDFGNSERYFLFTDIPYRMRVGYFIDYLLSKGDVMRLVNVLQEKDISCLYNSLVDIVADLD